MVEHVYGGGCVCRVREVYVCRVQGGVVIGQGYVYAGV